MDRASRSSLSQSDCGDGRYGEAEPMLPEGRLSGDEGEEEEQEGEEGEDDDDDEERQVTSSMASRAANMPKESPLAMALQILVPFLLAGFGTVSAGMVLDIVQVEGLGDRVPTLALPFRTFSQSGLRRFIYIAFTFGEFSRRFYPKRLAMSAFVGRKRKQHIVVGTVRVFIETSDKH